MTEPTYHSPYAFMKSGGVWFRRLTESTGPWKRLNITDLPHDPAAFSERPRSNGTGPVEPTTEWTWQK